MTNNSVFTHCFVMYSSSVASKVPHGESSFLMPADDHKDIIHTGLYIRISYFIIFTQFCHLYHFCITK